MLIIIRETVGCLSQQQDVCQITWAPCCALCTVRLFIKYCGCVQSAYLWNRSAYLWNNPYIYQLNIPLDFILQSS